MTSDGYSCFGHHFNEIQDILGQLKNIDSSRVLVMAQGTTIRELRRKAGWIVEECKRFGFGYTPRLDIELFGNRRGT